MDEGNRQKNKEEAVLLALQKDIALIRKDLEIWGMKKDGTQIFISRSESYERLWQKSLLALKNHESK